MLISLFFVNRAHVIILYFFVVITLVLFYVCFLVDSDKDGRISEDCKTASGKAVIFCYVFLNIMFFISHFHASSYFNDQQ